MTFVQMTFVQMTFVQEKEEAQIESKGPEAFKAWTLEGESDDEDKSDSDVDVNGDTKLENARCLDVKELELVVNFDAPNHYEDYVHRVGRTGRAGRKGCAVTFLSEDDAKYAPDLVKALELSEEPVPGESKTGGFKFNEEEDEVRKAAKKAQAKEYGFEEEKSDSEDENDVVTKAGGDISQQQITLAQIAAIAAPAKAPVTANQLLPNAVGLATEPVLTCNTTLQRFKLNTMKQSWKSMISHRMLSGKLPTKKRLNQYESRVELPLRRGKFYEAGRITGPGERKLYLFVEGPTEKSVKTAKAELKRVVEDVTNQAFSLPGGAQACL
ncbi:hypothetical protein ARALYDRAFT_341099 [Arabidopsis lyrata subsp. lyrata]|uniref:Helicase C-terminal domain-containing protein n=1 Tax=Arabidopsis lyrata subsp. lyrata TaxID=81972 RepID=D7L8A5_ARALL|nr:hypothetical protein ARALYDRAFT_341099 [Arabidopsis lyrata subsp. lyrata]